MVRAAWGGRIPLAARTKCRYKLGMSTVNNVKKKMGRPPVDSEPITVRFQRPLLNQIDEFAGTYGIGRPEAVRKLVGMAIALKTVNEELASDLEAIGTPDSLAVAKEIKDILGH